MTRTPWLTPSADPARPIPASAEQRDWAIDAALGSLQQEERRLTQLGFELPMARCREQRRFWEFVRAVHALDPMAPFTRTAPARSRKIA